MKIKYNLSSLQDKDYQSPAITEMTGYGFEGVLCMSPTTSTEEYELLDTMGW